MSRTRQIGLDRRIGAAVREARLNQGVTQDELAGALGVDRTTLARYESGARSLPIGALLQVAQTLAVPAAELVRELARQERPASAAARGALTSLVRVLEERPELLPPVLETVELLLNQRGAGAGEGAALDRSSPDG